jgi:probable F420-dependent oxidoreductase
MRVDTQLTAPLGAVSEQARRLRDAGFDGVFTFEGPSDVFFPLVEAAAVDGLDLYTNVAIAFPRSPLHLAHQAWDLQARTGGRFALGLGTQVRRHIEQRYSASWDHPVARMREMVLALRAIFASWQEATPLDFRGDFFSHTYLPPIFRPAPLAVGLPPIWVGAVGPRLTETVAEVADGLLVHPFHSERFLRDHALVHMDRGLATAGRGRRDLDVIVDVIVCTWRDEHELALARQGTKTLLAFYGSTPAYRPVLELHGWADAQSELQQLVRDGRWADLGGVVDDTMLRTLAVCGTPTEVAAQLTSRYAGLAERVGFYLPYEHHPDLPAAVIGAL